MARLNLWLQDGTCLEGDAFGAEVTEPTMLGELVFNTSMTGYQEILSDPSYCDQVVVMTYPLIGQYGVSKDDFESMAPMLKGLVVREACATPSSWRSEYSLPQLLKEFGVPGLEGIDTRRLTKLIRQKGAMKAIFAPPSVGQGQVAPLFERPFPRDQIARASARQAIHFPGEGKRVVMMDFGYKKHILRALLKRGCDVVVVPWDSNATTIRKFKPDGLLLSNGPGDPKDVPGVLPVIRELQQQYPMMCICMGHQLFALANGADTAKMKFGNRGANHPVKDLVSGRTYMTSQNHGYAVIAEGLEKTALELTQFNLNDGSVEGLRHRHLPAFSVQYHPEACPGPEDTNWLFDAFVDSMK
jgi:carbamoyl-phosphate synthase small subunit